MAHVALVPSALVQLCAITSLLLVQYYTIVNDRRIILAATLNDVSEMLKNDLKNETAFEYEQIFTKIDTYLKQNETINKNIKLYEELIGANQISSEAGMTSKYDLEILENTKTINEFDILINKINILQQYAKLYFKIKN